MARYAFALAVAALVCAATAASAAVPSPPINSGPVYFSRGQIIVQLPNNAQLCLSAGYNGSLGAPIFWEACKPLDHFPNDQLWTFYHDHHQIVNAHTLRCIDRLNFDAHNLGQWRCNAGSNQGFVYNTTTHELYAIYHHNDVGDLSALLTASSTTPGAKAQMDLPGTAGAYQYIIMPLYKA